MCTKPLNKTPLSASSNREIGGVSPSKYLEKLEKKGSVTSEILDSYVETHWIDSGILRSNDFQGFIIDRAKRLLDAIEMVTAKNIPGRDSDEVIQKFHGSLA